MHVERIIKDVCVSLHPCCHILCHINVSLLNVASWHLDTDFVMHFLFINKFPVFIRVSCCDGYIIPGLLPQLTVTWRTLQEQTNTSILLLVSYYGTHFDYLHGIQGSSSGAN